MAISKQISNVNHRNSDFSNLSDDDFYAMYADDLSIDSSRYSGDNELLSYSDSNSDQISIDEFDSIFDSDIPVENMDGITQIIENFEGENIDLSERKIDHMQNNNLPEKVKARDDLYQKLNAQQLKAVSLPVNQSVLILAGAGSGKTSVITARVTKLIDQGIMPNAIMAVTFTNKASQEMKVRLSKLMDHRLVNSLTVGTFHSLCSKILRDNFSAAGLPKSFAILDTDGQESICRTALKDLGLTKASYLEAEKSRKSIIDSISLMSTPEEIAHAAALSALKDQSLEDYVDNYSFITPGQCAQYISKKKEQLKSPETSFANLKPSNISIRSTSDEQKEAVFTLYQDHCAKSGLLDFQDLLTKTVDLLEKDKFVRSIYKDRYTHIMVDEFQDTNDIQYRWIELIKGKNANIMAVGDDYQSIYAFRGSNPRNMFRFLSEMTTDSQATNGRIIKLEQNYRSLPHILESANAIIDNNTGQMAKKLFTVQKDKGEQIDLVTYGNGFNEAYSIASSIHDFVKNKSVSPSEISVLYRTNQQSRLIEQELNKFGIPLTVYGGYRFFERQEVKIVLAYMDLVSNMTRDLSFVKIANFPPRGLGERTIEELRQQARSNGISMMEVIIKRSEEAMSNPSILGTAASQKKHQKLESFCGDIMDIAEMALTHSLHDVLIAIIDKFKIKEHYLSEVESSKATTAEADERISNIGELVSAATQFEIENEGIHDAVELLPEYLAHVALMTSTSESDMNVKNTVSLMTVHSSKGLEFDHVFIAGLDETIFPHVRAIKEDDAKSFSRECPGQCVEAMEEERRLMYVAVTRARKTLTITHSLTRMINGETKTYEPSRFLKEIPFHRLNHIDDRKQGQVNGGTNNNIFAALARQRASSMPTSIPVNNSTGSKQPIPQKTIIPTSDATRKLSIIGTAGRDKEKPMSLALWNAMVVDAKSRVLPTDTLVSGGAAWADHLAVKLYLDGHVKNLILHLPAPLKNGLFAGPKQSSSASAANYYHELFRRITNISGLNEIEMAIKRGATYTYEPESKGYDAMFARNKKVAADSQAMLAYTFGSGNIPADGGTKETWDKSKIADSLKTHVDLSCLIENEKNKQTQPSANSQIMKSATNSIFASLIKKKHIHEEEYVAPIRERARC